MTFIWTDESVRVLQERWAAGETAAAIAAALGEGCTRSAVIGKAHRTGCAARPSPIGAAHPRGPGRRPSARAALERPATRRAPSKPRTDFIAARAAAVQAFRATLPAPDARAIYDPADPGHEPTGCRYIHGHPSAPGWHYCQAARAGETTMYCAVHRDLCRRTAAEAEP